MIDGLVLVTGANGFIASRLIPRLLSNGHRVRVLARRPRRLAGRAWLAQVEVKQGSAIDEASLAAALAGVHTAYYLIHSMLSGRGYTQIEREGALRFASAASAAGVHHIVYLGGLADPNDPHLAPHMRSRIETGEALRSGRVPVTEFRAGVIVGAGSISFEMIRFLTECFPILPGPSWLRNEAQPIAAENVTDYLVAGLERPEVRGGIYEMGGPERMKYSEVMLRYAQVRGLRRWLFTIPGIPIWWMALLVDRLTPVPYPIATALIGGLQSDSSTRDDSTGAVFPEIKLIPFDEAARNALAELEPRRLERVWEGMEGDRADFRHEGFIVDFRQRPVEAPAADVFKELMHMGGPQGWPYANYLWRLRGWIDQVVSPKRARRGEEHSTRDGSVEVGSALDYYVVEALEPGRLLRLRSTLRAPGDGWMEWRVEPRGTSAAQLTQTAFFAPRGLPGFLYWFFLGPIHRLVFHGLVEALRKRSEAA